MATPKPEERQKSEKNTESKICLPSIEIARAINWEKHLHGK